MPAAARGRPWRAGSPRRLRRGQARAHPRPAPGAAGTAARARASREPRASSSGAWRRRLPAPRRDVHQSARRVRRACGPSMRKPERREGIRRSWSCVSREAEVSAWGVDLRPPERATTAVVSESGLCVSASPLRPCENLTPCRLAAETQRTPKVVMESEIHQLKPHDALVELSIQSNSPETRRQATAESLMSFSIIATISCDLQQLAPDARADLQQIRYFRCAPALSKPLPSPPPPAHQARDTDNVAVPDDEHAVVSCVSGSRRNLSPKYTSRNMLK